MKTLKLTVSKEKYNERTHGANFSRLLLTIIVSLCACCVNSASAAKGALGQLEDLSGQTIGDVQVPSVPPPSGTRSKGTAREDRTKKSPSRSKSSSQSMENNIKLQLFQGLLDGLMQKPMHSSPLRQHKDAQQEAERQKQLQRAQKERDLEIARQKHFAEKNNQLLGTLRGASTGTLVDIKNLDGDIETTRNTAGAPFDQSPGTTGQLEISKGTGFFGTTLSEPEITTLMEPENDPIIVDLNETSTFIVQSLKQNKEDIKKIEKHTKEAKKQKAERAECKELLTKYHRQIGDMQKFQKQIEFTKSQLDEWREKNTQAFMIAVADGATYVFGEYFNYLKETRSGAENIKRKLELIETKLIDGKVYTPAQIASLKTKLNLRMTNYRITKYSSEFNSITDYFVYAKNVIQSSITEIGETDAAINELLSNPMVKDYLGEFPAVDAAQFLASESMAALLSQKGFSRYSYVGIAQLAVNTAYNATDMYLSYKNICTLRKAYGNQLESARYLQNKISTTYNMIVECK